MSWKSEPPKESIDYSVQCWLCEGQGTIEEGEIGGSECDECDGAGRLEIDPYAPQYLTRHNKGADE